MTTSDHSEPALLALDWGTSSARAYLLDQRGLVLATRREPYGILFLPEGGFAAAFKVLAGEWLDRFGPLPALAAGMVGSRQGWRETPYVDCPAGAAELGARLTPLDIGDGQTLWLVPGVSYTDPAGVPDVMRGEETQIVGLTGSSATAAEVFLLPGTHSKWVPAAAGRIERFATFMSGELFDLLCRHSILGRLLEQPDGFDSRAFRRGVEYAAEGGLLRRLFSARSLGLFDKLPAAGLRDYLSGLVIGSEVAEGLAWLGANGPVTLVGEPALCERYQQALALHGIACCRGANDAAAAGLWRLAGDAGLLGTDTVSGGRLY